MIKTVWKFNLNDNQGVLKVPKDSEILDVQLEFSEYYIWFLVNPENETELRSFDIYITGESIEYDIGTDKKYIKSINDRGVIWHIFENIGM